MSGFHTREAPRIVSATHFTLYYTTLPAPVPPPFPAYSRTRGFCSPPRAVAAPPFHPSDPRSP